MSAGNKKILLPAMGHLWHYRELVMAMAWREILGRYRGSWLGIFWSLLTPILLLGVYTFVFGVIFKARWPSTQGVDENFAALLFCGIIIHGLFAEVLTRAPRLIVDNTNYVKRVVFPIDVLAWIATITSFFHFCIAFIVLLTFVILVGNGVTWTLFAVPLLLLSLLLLIVGVAWLVSALGVYFRDLTYVANFLATALIFLSPVFYPSSSVPGGFATAMNINPLTFYIEALRDLVVLGRLPEAEPCLIALAVAVTVFLLGFGFFQRVRPGFADVL